MKESTNTNMETANPASSILSFNHIGENLAYLRTQKELSTHDIAVMMQINEEFIINIEANDLDHIPSVFLRGYIRDYAKIVEMNEDIYESYLSENHLKPYMIKMRNYSQFEQKKKKGKRFFFIALLIILILVGAIMFYQYQMQAPNTNEFEVTHYIAEPPPSLISA